MGVRRVTVWLALASGLASGLASVLVGIPTAGAETSGAAAARWGPTHRFEQNTLGESFVQDGRGVTTVVWGSQAGWPKPVKAQQQTAQGRWRDPVELGEGHSPVVAADSAGNLVAAWIRDEQGRTASVWSARKPYGRAWSAPVRLSSDREVTGYPDGVSNYGAVDLQVAVRDGGAALVAWRWGSLEREVPFRVQAAFRPPRRAWQPARTLSRGAQDVRQVRADLGPAGVWVAWSQEQRRGPERVLVRDRRRGGTWSAATRVGTGDLGALALTAPGEVVVVFRQAGTVRSVVKPRGRRWRTPVDVTAPGVRARGWSAAVNSRGQALVSYLVGPHTVEAVRRGPRGRWGMAESLGQTGERRIAETLAAINGAGAAVVGWHNYYGVWARHRAPRASWGPTTTPHRDRGQVDVLESVRLGISPGGRPGLLWAQEERPLRLRYQLTLGR
ncbi:hypothetical protein IEQ44_13850 [Nocardioides sp. Y6]|uniref:Uncharacterized protein n=1 Tax=Nocardioides malaquae TaxID=2773426 RepID=A0ABR9RVV4_9ACTN|nr:hypothetical protein [Nocardioides malaquae]MBE7325732.1 hypothetical protein [Nocardioides malaquae]